MINGYNQRRKSDYEMAIVQSHLTAVLSRAKKIPKLESLLETSKPKRGFEGDLKAALMAHNEKLKHGRSSNP